MTTILPPIPRVVMTILEPISLLAGTLVPLFSPHTFIPSQLPQSHLNTYQLDARYPLLPTEHVLALQLCNLYFLLMMLGIGILNTTTEPRVVHAYVVALAVADIGHLAATGWSMGYVGLMEIGSWNGTMWGNIGATVVLFVTRVGYLLGALGEDRTPRTVRTSSRAKDKSS